MYDYYKEYIQIRDILENRIFECQTGRLFRLAQVICEYLKEAIEPCGCADGLSYDELDILQVNRSYGQYTGITSAICVSKDTASSEKYLFVLKNNRIKRYPERKDNRTTDYYIALDDKQYKSIKEFKESEDGKRISFELKEVALNVFIKIMIELTDENVVYEIITDYAKERGKGGKIAGQILYTDSNVKNNDIRIDKRMKNCIDYGKSVYQLSNSRVIYCNLNTDANITVNG